MKSFFGGPLTALTPVGQRPQVLIPNPAPVAPVLDRTHREAELTSQETAGASVSHAGRDAFVSEALIAVYDSPTAAPRVETVSSSDAASFIESLSARVFSLAKEAGGSVPYMVVRELTENFIHAGFAEAVVTILDGGDTIRFSDQGPGIQDKERIFYPGFSTATRDMKHFIRGVGSGLPIAKECLQFSGGSLSVEDNLGNGTVVTVRVDRKCQPQPQVVEVEAEPVSALPRLTTRQKRVLSLVMELGSVGPTAVANELAVGLSTAYRDLASLEQCGLLTADDSGKRVLTQQGVASLDRLLGL